MNLGKILRILKILYHSIMNIKNHNYIKNFNFIYFKDVLNYKVVFFLCVKYFLFRIFLFCFVFEFNKLCGLTNL